MAKKPARKADTTPKKRGGRPKGGTDFRDEYCEQAEKLCKLIGATDNQLAEFFEVDVSTVNRWKQRHPAFADAVRRGKALADAEVAERLYQRAMGYTHQSEDVFLYKGEIVRAPVLKHYPPDTTACIFWLKNRQKEAWRDVQRVDVSVRQVTQMDDDELIAIAAGSRPGAVAPASGTAKPH